MKRILSILIMLFILIVSFAVITGCESNTPRPFPPSPSGEPYQESAPVPEPAPAPEPTPVPAPISEPPIPAHFTTYTDEARFFSISYPPDWEPFPSRLEGIIPLSKDLFKGHDSDVSLVGLFFVFYAESPMESGISPASVNIVVQSLSDMTMRGWWTLDEIVEAKLRRTEEIKQEYHEFSRVNTIIGGREAIIIDWESYTSDLSGKVRSVQMFTIADKLVWKVTCYADSKKFDDFEDDLHAIVRSLRILK